MTKMDDQAKAFADALTDLDDQRKMTDDDGGRRA